MFFSPFFLVPLFRLPMAPSQPPNPAFVVRQLTQLRGLQAHLAADDEMRLRDDRW